MLSFEISFVILFTSLMAVIGCFFIFLIPTSKKTWIWTIFWAFSLYFAINPTKIRKVLRFIQMEKIVQSELATEFLLFFLLICIVFALISAMDSRLNRITRELMQLLVMEVKPQALNVSLILPAYNEEENISALTEKLIEAANTLSMEYEILLVDDGSKDRTGEICDQLSKKYPNVQAEHHSQNQGKTKAFETGVKRCKGTVAVLIETDLQYSPRDLKTLLRPFKEDFDFVNGWRVVRSDKLHRRILSGTYNYLVRSLFGTPFRDHNSGYKAFKKDVIMKIYKHLNKVKLTGPHRYFLVIAEQLGYRGSEVPVQHYPRPAGTSYINPFRTPLATFADMVRIRLLLSYRKTRFLELEPDLEMISN